MFLFCAYAFAVDPIESDALNAAAMAASDPYLSATGWASRLFGDIFIDPFGGEPDSAIGAILVIINLTLLLMGSIWVTYSIVSAGAMTAQEGQFIGKTMHSAWVPIRLVVGAASLTPFYHGLCLAQVVMLIAIKMSIGAGNMALTAGNDYVFKHNGTVKPAITTITNPALMQSLVASQLCMMGKNYQLTEDYTINVPPDDLVTSKELTTDTAMDRMVAASRSTYDSGYIAIKYLNSDGVVCGGYSIPKWQIVPFNVMAQSIQQEVAPVVEAIAHNQFRMQTEPSKPIPTFNPKALTALNDKYSQSLNTLGQQVVEKAMKDRPDTSLITTDQATARADAAEFTGLSGFTGAGATFYTLSKKNNAANAIVTQSVTVTDMPTTPKGDDTDMVYSKAYSSVMGLVAEDSSANLLSEEYLLKQVKNRVCPNGVGSLGQCVVSKITHDSSNESALIRISELGNWMIWVGGSLNVLAHASDRALETLAEKNWAAQAITAAASIVTFGGAAVAKGFAVGAAHAVFEQLKNVSSILFYFGIFAATYIPLVPAMVWLYRCVSLMALWVEGVVGASIWAFTHLDTQGEGMGSRAGHGYLFLFAILFNPILMVVGLFTAVGALEIITGFLNQLYPQMLADVNQDSMTGLFKIIGFVVIFVLINLTLVNLTSQFINIVPDQVTSWIGGQFQNHLGRNAEDQIGGKFSQVEGKFRNSPMSEGMKKAIDEANNPPPPPLKAGGNP